ncbi:hypothetical protein B0J14DRAFT_567157 [Halenospora varia]|nr:hypothetical protein B0J14DRAFT_567157 [Halenospora varia]
MLKQDTTGMGFRLKTRIHVRWGWIALPSVLTFAVAVLLLMTILKSIREKVPFWKSSSMITLLHDIEWADRESRITPQQSDIRARTKRVRMKLEGGPHLAVCGPRTRDQETN